MENIPLADQLGDAIWGGDSAKARELLTTHPHLLQSDNWANYFLRAVAKKDNVEMMSLLVEFGADIHAPDGHGSPPAPEGVIVEAAGAGAINAVRWLLDRGAKVNFQLTDFPNEIRCFALARAARNGHLDVVKLLVERGGADVNAVWSDQTPLSHAMMYEQREVETYLRSKGALEPSQLAGRKPQGRAEPVLEHIEKHLGKPKPLSLQEVLPGDPPITIHVVPMADRLALVTAGMSARPMVVPKGGETYQFAELVMYLPLNWPLTQKALQDPNHFWPIEWLRRIAHYPHEDQTWLGGPVAVFANDEPPQPLAPNTKLTCLLAITEKTKFGWLKLPDGRQVAFYTVYPLYTEERDLEKAKGTDHLLRLFEKHDISPIVDVHRPNVARTPGHGRRGSRRS